MRTNEPEIGTKVYFVAEHLYYVKGHAGPILEYCVCWGKVKGFFRRGYLEMIVSGKGSDGKVRLSYFKLTDIGKKVFFTPEEAAALAKSMMERYEKAWGWLGAPDIPLRRPWAALL